MFSVKRVAITLSSLGALLVGVYSALLLVGSCNANLACTASVYFGISQTEFSAPEIATTVKDTTVAVSSEKGMSLSEFHEVAQIVGFYLLLIGVFLLLALEVQELKLLRGKNRRKLARQ